MATESILQANIKIPNQEEITVIKDGNSWCAYRTKTFIDLHESNAVFADGPWEAINLLIESEH